MKNHPSSSAAIILTSRKKDEHTQGKSTNGKIVFPRSDSIGLNLSHPTHPLKN